MTIFLHIFHTLLHVHLIPPAWHIPHLLKNVQKNSKKTCFFGVFSYIFSSDPLLGASAFPFYCKITPFRHALFILLPSKNGQKLLKMAKMTQNCTTEHTYRSAFLQKMTKNVKKNVFFCAFVSFFVKTTIYKASARCNFDAFFVIFSDFSPYAHHTHRPITSISSKMGQKSSFFSIFMDPYFQKTQHTHICHRNSTKKPLKPPPEPKKWPLSIWQ